MTSRGFFGCILVAYVLVFGPAPRASGQNIDVSTLPPRAKTQLTIYNAADLTLVREERRITLAEGNNHLQFSWAGTLIDPTSVELQFLDDGGGEVEVVDTRFPLERRQQLLWTVRSDKAREATAVVRYFTSGLTWRCDYVATLGAGPLDGATDRMSFAGSVVVANASGTDFEDAEVRMVVGSVNLVEAIAQLAVNGFFRPPPPPPPPTVMAPAPRRPGKPLADPAGIDFDGGRAGSPKEIERAGLGEYFIFTVPGTETIRNGWQKRMPLFDAASVPARFEVRFRPSEYGDQLMNVLLVKNDEASSLGGSPLPDGAVQVFERTSDDGLRLVAQTATTYVPIGRAFELRLGRPRDVLLERIVRDVDRSGFFFRRGDDVRLFSPEKGDRVDPAMTVVGWTDRVETVERIEHRGSVPIVVAFRIPLEGDTIVRPRAGFDLQPTRYDARTIEWSVVVEPGAVRDCVLVRETARGASAVGRDVVIDG
jgi:hypothetical protein